MELSLCKTYLSINIAVPVYIIFYLEEIFFLCFFREIGRGRGMGEWRGREREGSSRITHYTAERLDCSKDERTNTRTSNAAVTPFCHLSSMPLSACWVYSLSHQLHVAGHGDSESR